MPEQTFDEVTARAWSRFTSDLAGYLPQMRVGDGLVLESHYDGEFGPGSPGRVPGPARVRLSAQPGDKFRCEVPPNRFLSPMRTLDRPDRELLYKLGFQDPDECGHEETAGGSQSYHVDLGPHELRELAELSANIFRVMWSVPDPAFLRGKASGREDVPEFDAWGPEIDEDSPESALQIAVEAAVAEMFGDDPAIDDEGVITLSYGDSHVHLRVDDLGGYIDVYAGIMDLAETGCEEEFDLTREVLDAIPSLNLQWPSVKWHLAEDSLLGIIRIDGAPFMPAHLTRALEQMGALLDSAGDIITELTSDAEAAGHPGGQALLNYARPAGSRSVVEVGPDHPIGPGDPGSQSPAAADTIVAVLRLNTGATSGLADDEVADICEGDVDLVLACLRIAKSELAYWQAAETELVSRGDVDPAEEQRGWSVVIDKLLGAIAALSR